MARVTACSTTCLFKILLIGVLASGVAYLLLFWGQSLTGGATGGAVLFLGEVLSVEDIIGGGLILLSLIAIPRKARLTGHDAN